MLSPRSKPPEAWNELSFYDQRFAEFNVELNDNAHVNAGAVFDFVRRIVSTSR
jgi:hypothetical protein